MVLDSKTFKNMYIRVLRELAISRGRRQKGENDYKIVRIILYIAPDTKDFCQENILCIRSSIYSQQILTE